MTLSVQRAEAPRFSVALQGCALSCQLERESPAGINMSQIVRR